MADSIKCYTTIKHEASAEFEEKRSLFIGYAKPIKSEDEAAEFIKRIKSKHSYAAHNVFGYTMKNGILARYSDDGEPQGTAGMPVLDVIRKSGVDDACVVVTRYFGGTLLGAGGLVRAYSQAAKIALEAAEIVSFEPYTELSVLCSYSDYQKISAELPKYGAIIDDTEFSDSVMLKIAVKSDTVSQISAKISEISAGKSTPNIIGERFDCL
jgi:uncharacterized YigZ family protein